MKCTTRADLKRRLADMKKARDELNADAAHWNSLNQGEEPIAGSSKELDDLIDSIEAGLNSGRKPV
jgi:hypothetical protein